MNRSPSSAVSTTATSTASASAAAVAARPDADLPRMPQDPPSPTQDGIHDACVLQAFVEQGERILAGLPPRPLRDAQQRHAAKSVHAAARKARRQFMRAHVEWVYDRLTDRGEKRLRLSAVCEAASGLFPGLVPSAEQMRVERRSPQAQKEGRERDQAIFLAELLAHPRIGEHLLESMRMPGPRALALQAQYRADGDLARPTVTLARREGIAYLTIENGGTLNAEDDALVSDLEAATDLALLDPDVRVCVLRGGVVDHPKYAGRRVFSAGINLKHLHAGRISFVEFLLEREAGFINKIYQGLLQDDGSGRLQCISKPWLAAVDSFAIGGGAQLLLVFDRVVAAEGSYVCLPAAKEGIVPGVANLRLSRHVGAKLARRIILGGHVVHAHDPEAGLLIDEVVAPERMDEAVASAARALDNPAVAANRTILNHAEEPVSMFRAYMAEFVLQQSERAYSEDVHAKVARHAGAHAASDADGRPRPVLPADALDGDGAHAERSARSGS